MRVGTSHCSTGGLEATQRSYAQHPLASTHFPCKRQPTTLRTPYSTPAGHGVQGPLFGPKCLPARYVSTGHRTARASVESGAYPVVQKHRFAAVTHTSSAVSHTSSAVTFQCKTDNHTKRNGPVQRMPYLSPSARRER
eukprot:327092-Rhodomonas_salina.2